MNSGVSYWFTHLSRLFYSSCSFAQGSRLFTCSLLLVGLLSSIPSALVADEGDTTRVSVDSSGADANNTSINAKISSDGRFVSYESIASDLVANDNNGLSDIFVHDRTTGNTSRVSVSSSGEESNAFSDYATISDEGRYITFSSAASNLVIDDNNGASDIFVHDRTTGQTGRVSVDSLGQESSSGSITPDISPAGRHITFASAADNLVADDTSYRWDIFVHNLDSGQTTRVSVSSTGEQSNHNSFNSVLSTNGRYVAFESLASNLVLNDNNNTSDIFVHDRDSRQTSRVSVSSAGMEANNYSDLAAISGDGRYVAFQSAASNLATGDTNGTTDIFVHDRNTHQTTRVSVDSSGAPASFLSMFPDISADGRYVAFASIDSNLTPGDSNSYMDVYIHDRDTSQTSLASLRSGNPISGNESSTNPAISADGKFVAFESDASLLVHDDFNGMTDIFVNEFIGSIVVPPTDADIGVTLSDSSDPVDVGSNISYIATVSNGGPADATQAVLSIDLDSNVTFVSTITGNCSELVGVVSCTLGDMASGSSTEVRLLVTAPFTAGALTSSAEATADQTDPVAVNNTDTETTLVILRDVDISDSTIPTDDLTILFGTHRIGETTDEIVTITNNSLSMPVSISVITHSLATPFQVHDANGCDGAPLNAGSSCILTVEYAPTVAGDATDTLILGIGADSVDISVRGTAVENAADLSINKLVDIIEVSPGVSGADLTTFTLTVSNNGPDAVDALVTDLLPADMQIPAGMTAIASLGGYDAASGEWSVGRLDKDQQETLEIPVQVVSGAGCMTNTATVDTAPGETITEIVGVNNTDSQIISATPGCADLSISARGDDKMWAIVGPLLTECMDVYFDVGVTNNGPVTVTGVTVKRNNLATTSPNIFEGIMGGNPLQWITRGYEDCDEHGREAEEEAELDFDSLTPGETKWKTVLYFRKLYSIGEDLEFTIDYRVESDGFDPDISDNSIVYSATAVRTGEEGSGGCFIATAAFGSPLAAEIELLREFRDRILMPNIIGGILINTYYELSPPLADIISRHESLRAVTRALLKPVIWWAGLVLTSPILGWSVLVLMLTVPLIAVVSIMRIRRNWALST